jgi:hypothetical protein
MSHITLPRRRFFPMHSPVAAPKARPPAVTATRPASVATVSSTRDPHEDLAYFGLCVDVNHDDPRAELEHMALLSPDAKPAWDDPWLLLL